MKHDDVRRLPGHKVGILGHRYTGHPGPWGVDQVGVEMLFPRLSMNDAFTPDLPNENEYGTMDPFGLDLLLRVARDLEPTYVLEIGTFHGLTTRRLAEAAPEARILTMDLPENVSPTLATDISFVDRPNVGKWFRDHVTASRITQMYADSAAVDARSQAISWLDDQEETTNPHDAEFPGFELVLIDAAHDYDSTIETFTNTVVPLLAPVAVVFFDDYARMASHTGVTHAVLELALMRKRDYYWYTPTGNTSHVAFYLHNELYTEPS